MTVAITYETQAVASQYIQPVQIRETSLFETVTDVYVILFFFEITTLIIQSEKMRLIDD